jgi:DNA (cytosine-5)-methyltransferase 1
MQPLKILDLFAGAGGLSLGFEMVKDNLGNNVFEMHRAVEIDKFSCETLRKKYDEEKVIEGDITKKEIHKKVIDECKGIVSLVVGGIPCQSFSLIGPRSGYGKQNEKFKEDVRDHLYQEFRDIVKEIKPKIIVIENVKGILSKKDKKGVKIIEKIFSDMENLGYNLENDKTGKKYMLLDAADYGVPQKRQRVVIIGVLKSWKDVRVPFIEPTHFDPESKNSSELYKKGLLPYVTLYEAIGDLPKVKPKITYTGLTKSEKTKIIEQNRNTNSGEDRIVFSKDRFDKHLKNISQSGKEFFNTIRSNGYPYLDHHIARSHQLSDVTLFKLMKEGETARYFIKRQPTTGKKLIKYDMRTFKDKYRRQESDKPCTTVFAHLEKDGNRFIHPKQARTLTPREAARVQSFPDDFIFEGPLIKKFRQIGNAVPVMLSFNMAKTIYDSFWRES